MKLSSNKEQVASLRKHLENGDSDKRHLERSIQGLKDEVETAKRQTDDIKRDRDRLRNSLDATGR